MKFITIETERLILRKFKQADTETFFKYRTDPAVAKYQGDGWSDYRIEQAVEFVKQQIAAEPGEADAWFQIAVELKESGVLIGDLAIHTLREDTAQVEIGYTIRPEYQNKGYAREAVKSLLEFIFGVMNCRRVIAVTDVRNADSIRLLDALGLRREGHFLKSTWNKGEYTDEYLYALLREEWS
jgi:RimJ/RimL family protein N-acetyltransferase